MLNKRFGSMRVQNDAAMLLVSLSQGRRVKSVEICNQSSFCPDATKCERVEK